MPMNTNKLAAATAVAAALSLLATPVAAVDLPRPVAAQAYDGDGLNAERHRRRWDGDDDIDAGDVVAGVVILGVIAAIAGAANRRNRYEQRYPVPLPDENSGYGTQGAYDRADSRGIGRAVDMCVGEVERGSGRVGSVDSATRSAEGWHVSGQLEGGAAYSCTIDNNGRISAVNTGSFDYGTAPAEAVEDGQWGDDYYAEARANQGSDVPGLDGELDDDGRYETAQAPDFAQ